MSHTLSSVWSVCLCAAVAAASANIKLRAICPVFWSRAEKQKGRGTQSLPKTATLFATAVISLEHQWLWLQCLAQWLASCCSSMHVSIDLDREVVEISQLSHAVRQKDKD